MTLIPGDGIGHEMANSVKTVFKAAQVPVEWEQFDLSGYEAMDPALLKQAVDSIRRNKVALKGINCQSPDSRDLILEPCLLDHTTDVLTDNK